MPTTCDQEIEEELNTFLRSRRIVSIHKELIRQDGGSFWAIAVEYATGEGRDIRKGELAIERKCHVPVSPDN